MFQKNKNIQKRICGSRGLSVLGVFLFGVLTLSHLSSAVAGSFTCSEHSCAGGGGHDVPTPFDATEPKFELADGEVYVLTGRVISIPSLGTLRSPFTSYFVVDLSHYPWLANSKRVQAPFYPLEGYQREWQEGAQAPIKIMCKAHARIVTHLGKPEVLITLEPITDRLGSQ